MQEHSNLSTEIYELLKDEQQLSISGITRELKKRNFNEHRLIVTGYLRAMHDMDYLNEFDLSPSKIYTLKDTDLFSRARRAEEKLENAGKSGSGNEIYKHLGEKISKMTSPVRLETAVYLFMSLFDRPCFESELNAAGIESAQISHYLNSESQNQLIFKSKADCKKYYEDIPNIPKHSQAYEINMEKIDKNDLMRAVNILTALLREKIDISELVSKTANKSLLDF